LYVDIDSNFKFSLCANFIGRNLKIVYRHHVELQKYFTN